MMWFVWAALVLVLLLVIARRSGDSVIHQKKALEKKCPKCAEWVRSEARTCRYCSHEFSEDTIFPSSIVGRQRKELMDRYSMKYSPFRGKFKFDGRWFDSFEEAAFVAMREDVTVNERP